jgi:Family of unknown function (DUF6600)
MSAHHEIGIRLRMTAAATLAAVSIAAAPLLAPATSAALAQQAQPAAAASPVADDVRQTLSQYGNFVKHQVYGEVWVPSVTPQGWHPYPPCHWVKSKQYGWYYDDKTPWGAIVHHYGRWTNDPQVGWFWVPGAEFSPGWVIWRTDLQWVGWAPMPPDEQIQNADPAQFERADFWLFMETKAFANNCTETTVVAGEPTRPLIRQTTFVRDVNIVEGILVFVLPTYVIGPIVAIDVDFFPWPSWFFGQVLIDWNWLWNNVNIVINIDPCPPVAPAIVPAVMKPPGKPTPPTPPIKPISAPPTPPVVSGGGGGGGLPPRCPDGSLPNAYGACPPPITTTCGPNMVAFGNFCLPTGNPTCARGTVPTRVGGGFRCLPPDVVTCRTGYVVDGKCVRDPPTCGPGLKRIAGGGCGPIVVTEPNCGPFATKVGGRCTPNTPNTDGGRPTGPTGNTGGSDKPGGMTGDKGGSGKPSDTAGNPSGTDKPSGSSTAGGTPPRGIPGGGIKVGGLPPSGPDNSLCKKCADCCVVRHPSRTGKGGIAGTGPLSTGKSADVPIRKLPSKVFTPSRPPSQTKPSYVIGRGGGGLSVFNAGGSKGGPSAGKTASIGNAGALRSGSGPILHSMPSMGGGSKGSNR